MDFDLGRRATGGHSSGSTDRQERDPSSRNPSSHMFEWVLTVAVPPTLPGFCRGPPFSVEQVVGTFGRMF